MVLIPWISKQLMEILFSLNYLSIAIIIAYCTSYLGE